MQKAERLLAAEVDRRAYTTYELTEMRVATRAN